MPTIDDTIAFIKVAHAGQKDAAGLDYYLHPIAVVNRLPADADLEVKLAALLHDVLEDTPHTAQDLLDMGYSARTVATVEWVTKAPDDTRSYPEKVAAIIAGGNRDAIQVKFADMSENADPERLALLPPERRDHFVRKYTAPLQALREALGY